MLSPIYKVNLIQQGPWMMHPSSSLLWDDGLGTSALHCGSWGGWLPQHRTHSMQGTSPLDPAASLLDTMLPIYHTTSFPICSCSICIPPSLPALVRKAFVSAINHETRERTNAKLLKGQVSKVAFWTNTGPVCGKGNPQKHSMSQLRALWKSTKL